MIDSRVRARSMLGKSVVASEENHLDETYSRQYAIFMKVGIYHEHMGRNCLRFEGLQPAVGEWVLGRHADDGTLVGEIVITGKAPSKNLWWFRREQEEGYTNREPRMPLVDRTKWHSAQKTGRMV